MELWMSLPWWSTRDAELYRALSLFPGNLEEKFLNPDEFKGYFKDFYGRPVQDIVEALHEYGRNGYFKAEIMLSAKYFKGGKALDRVTLALDQLRPEPEFDERRGLGEPVHAKVMAKLPLTVAEVRNLPDGARPYLEFKLSKIDRQQLREDLLVYDNSLQPSRLVKSTQSVAAPMSKSEASKIPPLNLSELRLKPDSYAKDKGVLHLSPFHLVAIAGKAGVKRPNGKKYEQCRIMECVFKSEKTLKHGVEISSILSIHKSIVDKSTTKKIDNAKTEINNKVADGGGPKNLIKIQNGKVFLNNSYL
jgi:hypothetical protein